MIYLIVFAISAILIYEAEKTNKKIIRMVCVILAIMIPAFLAGCRDISVGTDVRVYGQPDYEVAVRSYNFKNYYDRYSNSMLSDLLYHIMVFLVSRWFNNYHWGLFFCELITLFFAYKGMKKCKKIFNTPIWLGMLLYYLALYNVSLNIMRQCIAVSIVFYAVTFLLEDNKKYFFLFLLIATGFHSSAIVCIFFLPMYALLKQKRNENKEKQLLQGFAFTILLGLVLAVGGFAIEQLVERGYIRRNYLNYLSTGKYASSNLSYVSLAIYFGYLLIYLKHYHILLKKNYEALFFGMVSFMMFISIFGGMISLYISRVNYYFMTLQMLSMANIFNCYSKKSRRSWVFIIVGYSLVVWFVIFVIRGNHETIPYIFNPSR